MTVPPENPNPVTHGLSVDVEDYRQILRNRYQGRPGPVNPSFDRDMDSLLAILDDAGVRATFFVLGTVVRERAKQVRAWAKLGHEIASHGYDHRPIWEMSPEKFQADLAESKDLLEQAVGDSVDGYRAAVFSVRWDTTWALRTIARCGFAYDSSVVPVRTRQYGVDGFDPAPARYAFPDGASLVEIPITVGSVCGRTMPVAGGGYFRLLPYAWIRQAVQETQRKGLPFILYCHPDELGGQRFQAADLAKNWKDRFAASILSFRSNLGRPKWPHVLRRLCRQYRFAPMGRIAEETRKHGPDRILAETCSGLRGPV